MTMITNVCTRPNISGIGSKNAVSVLCTPVEIGRTYVVDVGAATGGTFRLSFGNVNGEWAGKPITTKATSVNTNKLFIRALNDGDTVTVSKVTVCTQEDWEALQKLGLDCFDGDTMPLQ